MDKVKIEWLVKKSDDWYVLSLIKEDGTKIPEVSVNKTSKKGELFPEFDNLVPGQEITGTLWQSDKGKWYLFPPQKPKTANSGAFKQKMIEDTMNKKAESISHFQASKEESIKLASAQRDAVLIVTTLMVPGEPWVDSDLRELILKWRNWFLSDDFTKDIPPF